MASWVVRSRGLTGLLGNSLTLQCRISGNVPVCSIPNDLGSQLQGTHSLTYPPAYSPLGASMAWNWKVEDTSEIITPALLIYKERVVQNLGRMLEMAISSDQSAMQIQLPTCSEPQRKSWSFATRFDNATRRTFLRNPYASTMCMALGTMIYQWAMAIYSMRSSSIFTIDNRARSATALFQKRATPSLRYSYH